MSVLTVRVFANGDLVNDLADAGFEANQGQGEFAFAFRRNVAADNRSAFTSDYHIDLTQFRATCVERPQAALCVGHDDWSGRLRVIEGDDLSRADRRANLLIPLVHIPATAVATGVEAAKVGRLTGIPALSRSGIADEAALDVLSDKRSLTGGSLALQLSCERRSSQSRASRAGSAKSTRGTGSTHGTAGSAGSTGEQAALLRV